MLGRNRPKNLRFAPVESGGVKNALDAATREKREKMNGSGVSRWRVLKDARSKKRRLDPLCAEN